MNKKTKTHTIEQNHGKARFLPSGGYPIEGRKTKRAINDPGAISQSGRDWKFDSISQCAAFTGTPVQVLRAAKKAGCAAFKLGSRVDYLEFLKWHWAQSDAVEILSNTHEQALLARSKREAQEMENAEKRKEIHLLAHVEELIWENGLGQFRTEYFAILKKYRQQPTPTMAVQILNDDLPKLLVSLRNALPSKAEDMKEAK